MIAFVTLFLGLVTGNQIVEVAVSGNVASVELRLDGELVGSLGAEPWKTELDFGRELMTHELVAVARDGAGVEVGRAVQQLNVPRSPIETEILLDGWIGGRPRYARLIWRSSQLLEPESIAISLDGKALATDDPGHIELPEVDRESLHFISAELTFPGNLRTTAQSIFGGRYGVEVEAELTAVPVRPGRRRVGSGEEAGDWLRRPSGEALRVVAVEDDVAELIVVRDEAALRGLRRLAVTLKRRRLRGDKRLALSPQDRLFLLSAKAAVAVHPEVDYALYPVSRDLAEASLPEALSVFGLSDETSTRQRLSDAVAVAGVRAAAGGRRRAVLLVVADCAARSGSWSGEAVRRFLAELRVPLVVWTTRPLDRAGGGFCRGATPLKDSRRYLSALNDLRKLLEKQQILWVEGRYLPREIMLADDARDKEVVPTN